MKKILILLLISTSVFGQSKKSFTLEDVFKKGTFSTKGMRGLRSMKDGNTYLTVETDEKTKLRYVAKNNYLDGKQNSILFKETD